MFLFLTKTLAKVIIRLLDMNDKIVVNYIRYLYNAFTQILYFIVIKLGGIDK